MKFLKSVLNTIFTNKINTSIFAIGWFSNLCVYQIVEGNFILALLLIFIVLFFASSLYKYYE